MNNESNTLDSTPDKKSSIIPIIFIALVYLVICAPFFPSGVCVGDSGDIQMSSLTLGIAHPPGYAGYSFIGWVLIHLFFWADPPFVITVTCHVSIIIAAALTWKILQHLDVNEWFAAGIVVLPLFNRMVWINATTAEIYAPSLALLMGITWQVICYHKSRARFHMIIASIMLGLLLGNRPPALFYIPAIVSGYFLVVKGNKRDSESNNVSREFFSGMLLSSAVTGVVISLCILLLSLRLWQDVPYNYVRQYIEAGAGDISDSTWGKVWWTISGQQFRDSMGANLLEMKRKLWWIRESFDLEWNIAFGIVLLMFAVGMYSLFKRDKLVLLLVTIVFTGQFIYLLQYKLQGQVADLLPLVYMGLIIISCPFGSLFNKLGQKRAPLIGVGFFIFVSMMMFMERERQPDYGSDNAFDLSGYAKNIPISDLPENAVILTGFDKTPAVWYACTFSKRNDLKPIFAAHAYWPDLTPEYAHRPLYYVDEMNPPEGFFLTKQGNLFRVLSGTGEKKRDDKKK